MSFGKNYDIFTDLSELERMLGSFENYLNSNELYGSVGGGFFTGGTSPQLTIGAILLRLRRLYALEDSLDAANHDKLEQLNQRYTKIRADMSDKYNAKMEREAKSRLDAMKRFFDECSENRQNCATLYNPEVLRRTIVQEILIEMKNRGRVSEDLNKLVVETDARLRRFISASEFVWDNQLQSVYPKPSFWWMWMRPVSYV